jgi:histidine triad (HIT) family protein
MATIFSRIIAGEIPSYKICENDKFFAFLDINPQVAGHTLVVPKVETDNLWDLEHEYLQEALLFAKPIAKAIEKAFECNRCGLSVVGLEVPHAHIHLLPISSVHDMHARPGRGGATSEELKGIQQRILEALQAVTAENA